MHRKQIDHYHYLAGKIRFCSAAQRQLQDHANHIMIRAVSSKEHPHDVPMEARLVAVYPFAVKLLTASQQRNKENKRRRRRFNELTQLYSQVQRRLRHLRPYQLVPLP